MSKLIKIGALLLMPGGSVVITLLLVRKYFGRKKVQPVQALESDS
jgi:hypothetical protein